jgi:hypothetical protein
MKFIIMENRLNNLVFNFLEEYFKDQEFNYSHPYGHFTDEDGVEVEGEDPNAIEYYVGDYYEDDVTFRLYLEKYWTGTNATADKRRSESPLLTIMDTGLEVSLDAMFGNKWENGFKLWFKDNFNQDVNRVR